MPALVSIMILLTIQEWSESQDGVIAKFGDGSIGKLSRSSQDYDLSIRTLASAGMEPVGVQWGEKGIVLAVTPARRDTVQAIKESPDGSLRLMMTKMNGVPRVRPENPQFSKIRSVAEASRAERREIWLAIQLPEFVVADAQMTDH